MDLQQGMQPASSYQHHHLHHHQHDHHHHHHHRHTHQHQRQTQYERYSASGSGSMQGPFGSAVSGAEMMMMMHTPVVPDTAINDDYQAKRQAQPTGQQNDQSKSKKRKSAKIRASKPAKSTTPAITPTTSSEVDSTAPRTAIDRVPAGRERRRIQMRIAQRAYRQRKQDEIYSRQKQLSERDCLIAQMKTAFDALSSRLVDLDVLSFYPDLSQPVQDMAQAFEALAQMKSATGSTAAAPAPAPAPASTATAETKDTDTGLYSLFGGFEQQQWTDIHDFGGDISSGQQQLSMGITVPPPYVTAGLRQAYNLQDFSNHYLHGQSQSHQFQQFTGNNERHYGSTTTTSSVASTGINDLKIPISMDIKPPTSYAFQETTFARRLMRVCTEAAYRVLMSGDLPSASSKEARVFKLAYRLWSKKYLVEKFQLALSSGDPSVPTIPFVSLGGAGTHYIHATMDQQPDKSAMPVASGPMAIHIAHIRHDGAGTSLDGIMSSLGLLNDEWFDALDVDLYLRSMGINLEAHSTNHRFLLPANPDVASKVVATSRAMGGSAQGVNLQDYVPAVVNVDRFMDCLVSKAMCLGRAAGFRKRDVEEQFYNSIEI